MSEESSKVSVEDNLFNLTVDFGYHVKLHGSPDIFLNEARGIRILKKEISTGKISEHVCRNQHHGRYAPEDQQC